MFIESNNKTDYDHIAGDTIKIQLQNIQSNIFDTLEMSYSDLTNGSNIDQIKNCDTVLSELVECKETFQEKL